MPLRTRLSGLIAQAAEADPDFIVLSGDHGYALFDDLRKARPNQFMNVGVAEQLLVSLAAGLTRLNYRPLIYGLSAFVPIRVLEQIKIDLCFSRLPVILLGDGAGLVYSTLGASHQCGEDIACLRAMPNMSVYSPCDAVELEACFREAALSRAPAYIRIGKSDRPPSHEKPLPDTAPHFVVRGGKRTCLAATGAMVDPCSAIAREFGLSCLSIPRLKPFDPAAAGILARFGRVIVVEEHSRHGGLGSAILESLSEKSPTIPRVHILGLEDRFTERCGSYQFALSEHGLSDAQIRARVSALISPS